MLQELRDLADTPAGKEALAIDIGDDDSVVQVQGEKNTASRGGREARAMRASGVDR